MVRLAQNSEQIKDIEYRLQSYHLIILQLRVISVKIVWKFVKSKRRYNCRQTPGLYTLQMAEQALIQQVLRFSLQEENGRTYSKENGLPSLLYKQIKSMKMGRSRQQCSICIEGFNQNQIIKKLPCSHILHSNCAKAWLKVNRRCPLCRFDLKQHFQQETQTKEIEKKQPQEQRPAENLLA